MRNGEADQSSLWLRADPCRPFVADFTTRARGRAGKRRDRRRMIVRLDLNHDVGRFARRAITTVSARIESIDARALDHRRIVGIRDYRALGMRRMRRANHCEETFVL